MKIPMPYKCDVTYWYRLGPGVMWRRNIVQRWLDRLTGYERDFWLTGTVNSPYNLRKRREAAALES